MTLRHLMGWDMIDLTYSVMMETKKGTLRWDDKVLVDVPTFESLPQWVSPRSWRMALAALSVKRVVPRDDERQLHPCMIVVVDCRSG